MQVLSPKNLQIGSPKSESCYKNNTASSGVVKQFLVQASSFTCFDTARLARAILEHDVSHQSQIRG